MKTQHLKKVKNGYVCPNCGATMVYENNMVAGEGWTDYWYECTGCHTTAND